MHKKFAGKAKCLIGLVFTAMFASAPVIGAEVSVSTGLGYDSNPFRLADSLSPEKEVYWKKQLDVSLGGLSPWFANLKAVDNSYNDSRADLTTVNWGVGYKTKFGERKHSVEFSLNGRFSKRTYVSRFTADVFEVGGIPAADRYDYRRINPRAEFKFNLEGRNKIFANIEYRQLDYEDFSQLLLSNLDYSSWVFDLGWQNYLTDKFRYKIQVDYSERNYDDRLARDFDGIEIFDSNLEYQTLGIKLQTRYRLSRQTYFYANLGMGQRSDNGGSYYDTDTLSGSIRFRHKTESDSIWTLALHYQNLEYERDQFVSDIENDAEVPNSQGFRGLVSYQRPVGKLAGGKLDWYGLFRVYDYSSDNPIYEYDRLLIETGLKLSLSP